MYIIIINDAFQGIQMKLYLFDKKRNQQCKGIKKIVIKGEIKQKIRDKY